MAAIVACISRVPHSAEPAAMRLLDAHAFRGHRRSIALSINSALGVVSELESSGLWRSGSVVAVADARIDNQTELAERLGLTGPFTVAELVGRAYMRWGREFPRELLGGSAVAVWDGTKNFFY